MSLTFSSEGRAELIESALERYQRLEQALKHRQWQARLRAQPTLVGEVGTQQAVLPEAVEYTLRRAESGRWPRDTPILLTVREVEALGERLRTLPTVLEQDLALLLPEAEIIDCVRKVANAQGVNWEAADTRYASGKGLSEDELSIGSGVSVVTGDVGSAQWPLARDLLRSWPSWPRCA